MYGAGVICAEATFMHTWIIHQSELKRPDSKAEQNPPQLRAITIYSDHFYSSCLNLTVAGIPPRPRFNFNNSVSAGGRLRTDRCVQLDTQSLAISSCANVPAWIFWFGQGGGKQYYTTKSPATCPQTVWSEQPEAPQPYVSVHPGNITTNQEQDFTFKME